MRVLITRPMEDAEPLAQALGEGGVGAIVEPLLNIAFLDVPVPDLSDVQGLLVTSANGIRAFARLSQNRDLKVWCVGDASARAARDAGFDDVVSAGGDVTDLADLIIKKPPPSHGTPPSHGLLHVAGSRLAGDLGGLLQAAGFGYERCVLYEATTATVLSHGVCDVIKAGTLDGILMYSPRTAEIVVRLVEKQGLSEHLSTLSAYCLSNAVAQKVDTLNWKSIVIAAVPEEDALLDTIFSAASES